MPQYNQSFALLPNYKYAHVSGPATTVAKSSSGTLLGVIVNSASASATVTLYDNTAASGTVIASMTLGAVTAPVSAPYSLKFNTGLAIVTTGTIDLTATFL